MANLTFANKVEDETYIKKDIYKILLVDDDKSIHQITTNAIDSMVFKSFNIEVISVYSSIEAKNYLKKNKDVALALIDVVMEKPESGLELVEYIREKLELNMIRLIIRTGQANEAPQMEVVDRYDIDDYKEKTELTIQKLFTTIRTSVRSYIQSRELQQKYEDIYKQMTRNHLTSLPNRILLNENLTIQTNKVLVLIDIISFSSINESNGFDVGDMVLKELGGFLESMYGDKYDVYHLDSDLFAIVLPSEIPDKLQTKIAQIKKDIAKLHIITNNFNRTIDTTIGVAYQGEKNTMQKAELALNEAKNQGKNQITYYSEDLKIIQKIENTQHWGGILKEAIQSDDIIAYYQPIVDTFSGEIYKYEMLVRLKHEGKIYTPYYFLEAAENTGQLYDIFKYMFTTACVKVNESNIKLSVNIGDIELSHPNLMVFIKKTIEFFDVDISKISLEILEYNSISEHLYVKDKIIALHNLGFEIVIDDFGTRCSNFSQIENLPIGILKIDGQYIKDIDTCENSRVVTETIFKYAQKKGLKVVAEFVHSQEVYDIVKEIGLDYMQGYHLSEPKPSL